jgi:hypothetical protein
VIEFFLGARGRLVFWGEIGAACGGARHGLSRTVELCALVGVFVELPPALPCRCFLATWANPFRSDIYGPWPAAPYSFNERFLSRSAEANRRRAAGIVSAGNSVATARILNG